MSGIELYSILVAAMTTTAILLPIIAIVGIFGILFVGWILFEVFENVTMNQFFVALIVGMLLYGFIWL